MSITHPNTFPANTRPPKFCVGEFVTIGDGDYRYEVAEIRLFPHGYMVGIFDEPPSRHIDYWKPESLRAA